MRTLFLAVSLCSVVFTTFPALSQQSHPPFLRHIHHPWVDSVMRTMTPDERIAQLIMVAAWSNKGDAHREEIVHLIREYKIGGLVFFQGGPVRQARLINAYQGESKIPLLVAMDAEWGVGMRLDSTLRYPYQMTLGALHDDDLIRQMGREVARQLKRVGVHVNFAPVVDVNNNPDNPVIGFRSFGEDKYKVAAKGVAYMKGMQDENLLTTAKHFPGHGDTNTDSHHALPLINHGRERLDSLELYPFRALIRAGVGGIMVAHLNIPALDSSGVPSTLSGPIVTQMLRKELGFGGLIFTDAMNMKGVTGTNPPGVVDKNAILAGNDALEFTEDVPRTIAEIRAAIQQRLITQDDIDQRCRKVLAAKYWVGLHEFQPVDTRNLASDLNTPAAQLLNRKLMESALTVLKNDGNLIPLARLDTLRIASVSVGPSSTTPFQKTLDLYSGVTHFNIAANAGMQEVERVREALKNYNLVIGAIHETGLRPYNKLDLSDDVMELLAALGREHKVILTLFKNPYVVSQLVNVTPATLILTYEDNGSAEELAAQLIFGGVGASGRLPVTTGGFRAGHGLDVAGGIRMGYTLPEEVGMNSAILFGGIDSLVAQALGARAIPGCQVLVARNRKVILHKAYGLHTYSDTVKVRLTDLYDLASVTKISTSMAALMKLYDDGKFKLDATLGDYLPKFRRSNKADIPMHDILTHQGRLIPFIPFYQRTVRKNGSYRWFTIKKDSSERFPIRLSENMFLHRNYPDKMVKGIRKSPLRSEKKYVYSDFFFMLAPRVVESMIDGDFDTYLREHFYAPLGATTVTFNPALKYPIRAIVPTENDYLFRHKPVHGTVHDENAAMLRGISGHAGLFANANDLAKLMQMYLDMGTYGGQRFIREVTLREFSRTQYPENDNRRALGFDKPNLKYLGVNNNTAEDASPNSFGHTGFTGTFAWMDPDQGLLYIFLSNRVNPTRENTRLYQLNTRTQIQQVMYDALE